MNTQNTHDGKRATSSSSTIQSDKASSDASSGKSATAREPQQGAAIDAVPSKRSDASGNPRPGSSSKR